MPRDNSGVVTLPTNDSSPAAPRNVIRSSDFNELMTDISSMMQDSLSRSGKGGMTSDLDLDGNDLLNPGNFGLLVKTYLDTLPVVNDGNISGLSAGDYYFNGGLLAKVLP